MAVGANTHSASWGNFSMRDHGRIPSIEFNNSPTYNYAGHFEPPYFQNYEGISTAVDVINAIGTNISAEQYNAFHGAGAVARTQAFVNFTMGLSYLYIGASYDSGALLDETDEFNGEEFVSYDRVVEFGLEKMDNAISIAEGSDFTIPGNNNWFFNVSMTSDELVALANSMKAKYATLSARTPDQRATLSHLDGVEWADVKSWVENGMEATGYTGAFAPEREYPNDPAGFMPVSSQDDRRFNEHLWYGNSIAENDTWVRSDYESIGPADNTGGFEEWKAQLEEDPSEVSPYTMSSPDARIEGDDFFTCADVVESNRLLWPGPGEGFCTQTRDGEEQDLSDDFIWGVDDFQPIADGSYHGNRTFVTWVDSVQGEPLELYLALALDSWPFPTERGTWFHSDRGFNRFEKYRRQEAFGNAFAGPMPHTLKAEMDLLKAEAILHGASGNNGEVASLINNTRVDNGGLPPAEASDPEGSIDDAQDPLKDDDDGATLWSMLKHERVIEAWGTSSGVNFFVKRGWGDLPDHMQLHYPVPGNELETLGEGLYTFGGQGGDCTTVNPDNCIKGTDIGGGNLTLGKDYWANRSESSSAKKAQPSLSKSMGGLETDQLRDLARKEVRERLDAESVKRLRKKH